jgi:plasmid stability protein
MGQVLIRNLDDALIADYKRAAADHGRSLESELRHALAAQRPRKRLSPAELIALSEALRANTPAAAVAADSTLLIREDRDSR